MSIIGYDALPACGVDQRWKRLAKCSPFLGEKLHSFQSATRRRRDGERHDIATCPLSLSGWGSVMVSVSCTPSGLSLAFTFFHTTTLKARTPIFPTPLTNLRPSACTLRRWRCRSLCLWQRPRALAPLLPHLLPPPPPPWLPPANLHPRRSVTGNACAAGRLPDAVRSWWW